MLTKNGIPSVNTTVRVVLYAACAVVLGMSWSFTLELMNTTFEVGVLGCLSNLLLSLLLVRYVVVKHFINPGAESEPSE